MLVHLTQQTQLAFHMAHVVPDVNFEVFPDGVYRQQTHRLYQKKTSKNNAHQKTRISWSPNNSQLPKQSTSLFPVKASVHSWR